MLLHLKYSEKQKGGERRGWGNKGETEQQGKGKGEKDGSRKKSQNS